MSRQWNGMALTCLAVVVAGSSMNFGVWALAETPATKPATAMAPRTGENRTEPMNIRLTINGKVATATLDETPSARDFAALLPLTLDLNDYAATEKISNLPRRLSLDGAPPGYDPSVGDITYYAPWGNLAIFYRDFEYSKGLIRLGTIHSGLEALQQSVPLTMTIERVAP
mgnify:CR=1 FL=1